MQETGEKTGDTQKHWNTIEKRMGDEAELKYPRSHARFSALRWRGIGLQMETGPAAVDRTATER